MGRGRSCADLCGEGGVRRAGNLLALHLDQGGSDAAHAHSPLQPDEAILSPAGSPGVLDQPVVHSVVSAVTNNLRNGSVLIGFLVKLTDRHSMVCIGRGAALKDAGLVFLEWPRGSHAGTSIVQVLDPAMLYLVTTAPCVATSPFSASSSPL